MTLRLATALLLLLALSCRRRDGTLTRRDPAPAPAGSDAAGGAALAERFECHRCHEGLGLPAVPLERHCVRCHTQIVDGTSPFGDADVRRGWRERIVHLREVPSLRALGRRLDPRWVRAFLREPHVVRPALGARMPRLALTAAEASTLAAWLCRERGEPGAVTGDPARGRALFVAKGCGGCHRFSGVALDAALPLAVTLAPAQAERARRLAPDLRETRDRWVPSAVVRQLVDPRSLDSDARMPRLGLRADEARDLAAFVLTAPLAAQPTVPTPPRGEALRRPVGYAEVAARVLRRTCWHCHADVDYARGEGGPGNAGGFGFAPRGVDLSSFEAVHGGALDDRGERVSILRPGADGTATLARVLRARQAEEAGRPVPGVRGMPLGLPALSDEEIALVERWVAEGAPYAAPAE